MPSHFGSGESLRSLTLQDQSGNDDKADRCTNSEHPQKHECRKFNRHNVHTKECSLELDL